MIRLPYLASSTLVRTIVLVTYLLQVFRSNCLIARRSSGVRTAHVYGQIITLLLHEEL